MHAVSTEAKLLAAYLLTGPHSNGLGCYWLPDGYIQADLGWSSETVSKGFTELFQTGFAERCKSTQFVLMPKFLKWNQINNGNVAAARIKEFSTIPEKSSIFANLCKSMLEFGNHLPNHFTNRLETISKGLGKQDPTLPDPTKPETRTRTENKKHSCPAPGAEREQESDGKQKPVNCCARFDDFWNVWPKKEDKKNAMEVWKRKKLDAVADVIIEAVITSKRGNAWSETKFIPGPAKYLRGERWNDEVTSSTKPHDPSDIYADA